MKTVTVYGGGNWLELEVRSRGQYRVLSDSIREEGDPITRSTFLSVRWKDDVHVEEPEGDEMYYGHFRGEWQGVHFDFKNQENLLIFGPLKKIREALEQGIITNACVGDV